MDFGSVLHAAQKNAREAKPEGKYYTTKFAPPKKETKEKKLSANIQKFLAKQEHEEREKARIAKQQREELMAKRDPKLKRKIEKMLKVIKSANKSVLEDAVDHQNTAITLEGPQQCDDDDYGYVSQESSALYAKIMQKYTSMPEEKKFPESRGKPADISTTKARVRDALNRAQEEENAPHQRKPRQSKGPRAESSKSSSEPYVGWGGKDAEQEKVVQEKPKKKRPPPPPALDFQQLLALAAQKQHEPVQVEVAATNKEPERLMTKKQREEMEERKALQDAKAARLKGGDRKPSGGEMLPPKFNKIPKATSNSKTSFSIPKLSASGERIPPKTSASSTKPAPTAQRSQQDERRLLPSKAGSSAESPRLMSALTDASRAKASQSSGRSSASGRPPVKSLSSNVPTKTREFPPKDTRLPATSRAMDKARPSSDARPSGGDSKKVGGPRPQSSSSTGGSSSSNNNNNVKSRPFPPPDHRSRDQRPPQQTKVPKKRPIIEDDDSEYDSELEDFIDDGEDQEDYSSHIKAIFGYDKSRYRDEDFDDRQMESNFAQVMREEYVSKKIGMQEDLEDMKMEEEEKKRKAKRKKI